MSKRKVGDMVPPGDKAAGKRRAEPELDDGAAVLGDMFGGDNADLTEVVDNADALADAIGGDAGDEEEDDGGDDDALLAAALGGDDDDDDDDDGGDGGPAEPAGPALPEPGELPDGVTAEQLSSSEEVDLTEVGELTLAQARRVAIELAKNTSLSTVKVGSAELSVGDLADEGELEWDSEDYSDVEAIIIAELLKANTSVSRLDLARNQIGDAGACALALMLCENSTIEYLNLESNIFGERGGAAFCEALSSNSSVQYLNLMYNSVPSADQTAIRQVWQDSSRSVGLHL